MNVFCLQLGRDKTHANSKPLLITVYVIVPVVLVVLICIGVILRWRRQGRDDKHEDNGCHDVQMDDVRLQIPNRERTREVSRQSDLQVTNSAPETPSSGRTQTLIFENDAYRPITPVDI